MTLVFLFDAGKKKQEQIKLPEVTPLIDGDEELGELFVRK